MSTNTSWYYKPINSPRYPGLVPKDPAFITQSFNGRLGTANTVPTSPRNYRTTSRSYTAQSQRTVSQSPLGGAKQHYHMTKKSPEEFKLWLDEIRRPTEASMYRFDSPKNTYHFAHRYISVDGTSYKWHKMDVMRDSYKALWSRHGSVKGSFNK